MDGQTSSARFNRPMGIAVAPDGTVYVADCNNHTIRQISPEGVVTTLAGMAGQPGRQDGLRELARFHHPVGLALDAAGNLYVADTQNHTIRKVTPAGLVITMAGRPGEKGTTDGEASKARFNFPQGITAAPDGTVYIADTESHTIRQLTTTGVIRTVAGMPGRKGAADGTGANARFFHPSGLATNASGTLYIVDNGNHTIRKIESDGMVRTIAGAAGKSGSADGQGTAARFDWPNGIAVNARGWLYVADNVNSTIRLLLPNGQVTTLTGRAKSWGSQDGAGSEARFEFPFGVALHPHAQTLYVTDTKNQLLRCVQ
ncbi:hypothetical protein LGH70_09045 [Hymenobacter sp. BT635]|uniref:SMP-30/Gluconolactonase/LRE-like region domain-containing protein n=1 Tax=Hymenobacter nitidus TaxID=2880929 RepID=A0ABS8ABF6_9BACT|nr:NHL repeat-containing protein [Hymenobacter nitidus]MCB2377725.1 hypothetical protein [Hymenobacter nitidus]